LSISRCENNLATRAKLPLEFHTFLSDASEMGIRSEGNEIFIYGKPGIQDVRWAASALYKLIDKMGYQDVILDFSNCENVFERFVLPIVCLANYYRQEYNSNFELRRPSSPSLSSLFHNANWSHLIDPEVYEPTTFAGAQHVPALQFFSPQDHYAAVDKILDAVLCTLPNLSRDSLKALKWSLDEITDNVLQHSSSKVGGFLQASTFTQSGCVEFVVADAGETIPTTLNYKSHKQAIEKAIQEGVTRNKETNRGNGLFGAYQIATLSGGSFEIVSGKGLLSAFGDTVRFAEEKIFFPGTVVASKIDCTKPDLLSRALRFDGIPHNPAFDYIEQVYENEDNDDFVFQISDEAASLGSREAARSVATKLENLLNMNPSSKIILDFAGVNIVSSSFADEVFGKLFKTMGPLAFMSRLEFKNMDRTVRALIDRSIRQRM
jgi:hypothetical protein